MMKTPAEEAAEKFAEAQKLARLSEAFPDLKKYVGRWNRVAYYSQSVNSRVDKVFLRHNCGCCESSPLEAWPYLETPDGQVYSDPPRFFVGTREYSAPSGECASIGWDKPLYEAGINEAVIGQIRTYMGTSRYDDDEPEEEVDSSDS